MHIASKRAEHAIRPSKIPCHRIVVSCVKPVRAPASFLRERGPSWPEVVVRGNRRQPHRVFILAGLARLVLMTCLIAAVLFGPFSALSQLQADHPEAITAGLADGAPEAPAHCDPGPPCAAFLVPAHMTAGQTTRILAVLVRARDRFHHRFGGPAIDLPPPRRSV